MVGKWFHGIESGFCVPLKEYSFLQKLNYAFIYLYPTDLKSEFTTTKENLRSTEEVVAVLRGELSRKSKELMNTFDFSREGQV